MTFKEEFAGLAEPLFNQILENNELSRLIPKDCLLYKIPFIKDDGLLRYLNKYITEIYNDFVVFESNIYLGFKLYNFVELAVINKNYKLLEVLTSNYNQYKDRIMACCKTEPFYSIFENLDQDSYLYKEYNQLSDKIDKCINLFSDLRNYESIGEPSLDKILSKLSGFVLSREGDERIINLIDRHFIIHRDKIEDHNGDRLTYKTIKNMYNENDVLKIRFGKNKHFLQHLLSKTVNIRWLVFKLLRLTGRDVYQMEQVLVKLHHLSGHTTFDRHSCLVFCENLPILDDPDRPAIIDKLIGPADNIDLSTLIIESALYNGYRRLKHDDFNELSYIISPHNLIQRIIYKDMNNPLSEFLFFPSNKLGIDLITAAHYIEDVGLIGYLNMHAHKNFNPLNKKVLKRCTCCYDEDSPNPTSMQIWPESAYYIIKNEDGDCECRFEMNRDLLSPIFLKSHISMLDFERILKYMPVSFKKSHCYEYVKDGIFQSADFINTLKVRFEPESRLFVQYFNE